MINSYHSYQHLSPPQPSENSLPLPIIIHHHSHAIIYDDNLYIYHVPIISPSLCVNSPGKDLHWKIGQVSGVDFPVKVKSSTHWNHMNSHETTIFLHGFPMVFPWFSRQKHQGTAYCIAWTGTPLAWWPSPRRTGDGDGEPPGVQGEWNRWKKWGWTEIEPES